MAAVPFRLAVRSGACCAGLLLWAALGSWQPAAGQEATRVQLSPPDVGGFPELAFFVSVVGPSGLRVPGLAGADFQVLEDQVPLPAVAAEEVSTGVRLVFALNTNARLKLPSAAGRPRYDLVREALLEWWQMPASAEFSTDDLTLLTTDEVLVAHGPFAAGLASALDQHVPAFAPAESDLTQLTQALTFLTDPAPRPGMSSAVIFITPPILPGQEVALEDALARAAEIGASIYPVLVGPAEALDFPETLQLQRLAEGTGGSFLFFDADAGLTGLADRLVNQRIHYRLACTSAASGPGPHALQVRVRLGTAEAESNTVAYSVDVRPPEVAFIDPPSRIERVPEEAEPGLPSLTPSSHSFRILITFPDQHPRPITSSELFVDGRRALTRAQEPFDQLEWDLTGIEETGTHRIRAVVQDSLGLQASTLELDLEVRVVPPPRGLAALRPAAGPLLAVVGILLAGILIAVGVFSRERRRGGPARIRKTARSLRPSAPRRASLMRETDREPPEAFLVPEGAAGAGERIPLRGEDLTLGADASLCGIVLEDPSVAALHARLIRQAGGDYLLRDQGSVAGTWANLEPVPPQGRRLRHGDLIHLGRVAFRFRLATPPDAPPVVVRSDRPGGMTPPHGEAGT